MEPHVTSARMLITWRDGQMGWMDGGTDIWSDELPLNEQMWGLLTLAPNYITVVLCMNILYTCTFVP